MWPLGKKMWQQVTRPGAGLHAGLAGTETASNRSTKKRQRAAMEIARRAEKTAQKKKWQQAGRPRPDLGPAYGRRKAGRQPEAAGLTPAQAGRLARVGREAARAVRPLSGLGPARPAWHLFFFFFFV